MSRVCVYCGSDRAETELIAVWIGHEPVSVDDFKRAYVVWHRTCRDQDPLYVVLADADKPTAQQMALKAAIKRGYGRVTVVFPGLNGQKERL